MAAEFPARIKALLTEWARAQAEYADGTPMQKDALQALAWIEANPGGVADGIQSATNPNVNSEMLSRAVVGGAGMMLPPNAGIPPRGMGAVLLYVPLEAMQDKSPIEMQADMGLPWAGPGGEPVWFPQNQAS